MTFEIPQAFISKFCKTYPFNFASSGFIRYIRSYNSVREKG
jgi:hypothetical protein